MTCWTRLFRKRLLPLLLAAVMLTGMLPQLTVVAQAEEQGRKIDLTESSVSHHGTTADNTRPKRWVVDGDRTQANYFVTGNDQTQTANTENPANPGYWLQLDLGQKYSITKLNLCIYYDGRYLKDLVVLASNEAEFTKENSQVVYNADSNNFFGLGAGTDSEMPAQNNNAGFDITPTPVVEAQYLRIFNNGNSKNDGAHWIEVEVYGTETTSQPMLYNVANGRKATVNKDGSVDSNRPASLMTDGDKSVGQYTEISRDKVQDKNDPSYAQIDLGDVYPISRVNFQNYWADGRTLKDLKIILSEDPHFNNATTIYSQDYTATEQGLAATPENPVRARYIRVWNDGHDKGNKNGGHYIEIEAWSTETQRPVQPEPFQLGGILNIPTYTANGKDGEGVTHPDVLDFTQIKGTGGAALDTWGGYRYWMAVTPNQTGNSQFENPCLAASSDGITWVVPTGITNPLTNVPREPDNTHNCDTDMIYDPNSDQLWVYYIWEQDSPRGTPSELRRIQVGYSEGNFTVGQYEVCTKSSYQYDMQSPAVVRRGAGQWLMWSNNSDQNDGVAGWQNQNAFVELRQSQDGKTWGAAKSLKQSLILKGEGGVEYYIIPREIFDQAQKLLKKREVDYRRRKCPGSHPLTGKIVCGYCGSPFRRKEYRGEIRWVCMGHERSGKDCPITPITGKTIYEAFCRLYYKLKHQSLPILEQMLETLRTIRDRRLLWSEDIVSLNKKISELSSQNQTLAFLKQNGLVDPDIFISKSNELTRQLRQAKLDKEELMAAEGDATAQRTRELIALLEDGPDFLDRPDAELCGALVAEIIVESNDTLRFRLHNGLELRESIERTVR